MVTGPTWYAPRRPEGTEGAPSATIACTDQADCDPEEPRTLYRAAHATQYAQPNTGPTKPAAA